jgi:solute carrier family 35 (UDP-galactose transporter), member B1
MARQKQRTPLQRLPSSEIMKEPPDVPESKDSYMNGSLKKSATIIANCAVEVPPMLSQALPDPPGLTQLLICVLGIYASLYACTSPSFACPLTSL